MIKLQRNTTEHVVWAGAQVVQLGVLASTVGVGSLGWLAGTAYGFAAYALLRRAMHRHGIPSLGPADRVTLARAVLVGGVTVLVADSASEGAPTRIVVTFGIVALVCDLLDGQVARRTGTASALGARLDMEVDAFLILVLSVHVALAFGPWVLAIGAMRYLFIAASWTLPWLRADLPASLARKTVAALQGIVLVAAASGIVPHAHLMVELALVALLWSFGRDIVWLRRNATVEGLRHA